MKELYVKTRVVDLILIEKDLHLSDNLAECSVVKVQPSFTAVPIGTKEVLQLVVNKRPLTSRQNTITVILTHF